MIKDFLVISNINIHNANALSSPYTIGFPAMTAWLGFVHALQRKLNQHGVPIVFDRVAVSCHQFDLQTYKGEGDYVYSIIGTANPLNREGSRPSFIEEARCHLTVSLLIEYNNTSADDNQTLVDLINSLLPQMKIAGGDLLSFQPLADKHIKQIDTNNDSDVKGLLRRLMLGYVIKERRDLMVDAMEQKNENQDVLDVLLDFLSVKQRAHQDEKGKVTWTSSRKEKGWLVPIAVGFQGISALGKAAHQRDENTPHRFAESVLTLGEFVMPYSALDYNDLNDMLWRYQYQPDQNLYLCVCGD
jgi:CRISPR-associated protein Csy2